MIVPVRTDSNPTSCIQVYHHHHHHHPFCSVEEFHQQIILFSSFLTFLDAGKLFVTQVTYFHDHRHTHSTLHNLCSWISIIKSVTRAYTSLDLKEFLTRDRHDICSSHAVAIIHVKQIKYSLTCASLQFRGSIKLNLREKLVMGDWPAALDFWENTTGPSMPTD
jgi:hypothetical protein